MTAPETFWTLLHDKAHWEFEMFLMLLFDGLVGAAIWPFIKKHWQHHVNRDKREGMNGHSEEKKIESGKEWERVRAASVEFTERNFDMPRTEDYMMIYNAMLTGMVIALEEQVGKKSVRDTCPASNK